jgi:hypothetical protein
MRITFPMSQGSRSGSMCRSTTGSWSMASGSWAMSWTGSRSWASSWAMSFKYWSRR